MQAQHTETKTKNSNPSVETKPSNQETQRPANRPNDEFNWDAWWNEYYETHE